MGKESRKVKVFQRKKRVPEKKIIENLQSQYNNIDESIVRKFSDLPLSTGTQKGLRENEFINLTDIQRQSIGLALRGFDILGAAKTGSGKTLAFLIPVIELLYCKQWTRMDGLGALIITPTRELAYQIYEVLHKIGHYHDLSAGLIIGGKDLHFEKKRMNQCNIMICTPGRLLQHMDENPLFDCTNMQILVLDEADRCLDMGFQKTVNAIIENLPEKRQSLLFSATQTKSLRDLATLSLKDPIYVSAHEYSAHTTPEGLHQSYIICELEEKMSMLWSFVRNHLKHKVIIFLSTCKQVKFIYEAFCRMRPGIRLFSLHGRIHQLKRMNIYETFCKQKHAVLFSTDIASRGLDFPNVNWVVQMDCPEDVNAYIHRAGRTARFQNGGESLLVLLPSETSIINQLHDRKIPISLIKVNPNKWLSPQSKLESLLAHYCALKERAQRAFVTYVKSIFLMKDKQIFNVHALNTDAYARSLGLMVTPRIRFLQKFKSNSIGNKENNTAKESNDHTETLKNSLINSSSDESSKESFSITEIQESNNFEDGDSDADDILTIKRKNIQIDLSEDEINNTDALEMEKLKKKKPVTKASLAKKILKKKIVPNKKTYFDESGQEVLDSAKSKLSELGKQYEQEIDSGINIEMAKQILRHEDSFDKERFKRKIKEKHREEKRKLKAEKNLLKTTSGSGEECSEEDNGSDDGSDECDLSWLPDPDEIYGKEGENIDDKYDLSEKNSDNEMKEKISSESEISEDEDQIHRPSKKRLITIEDNKKSKKMRAESLEFANVEADEELALQLLRN